MTRYADPRRCPDCLGPIAYGTVACPNCGLSLEGQTARRLYATLSTADELLGVLRIESVPVGATATAAATATATDAVTGPATGPTPLPGVPVAAGGTAQPGATPGSTLPYPRLNGAGPTTQRRRGLTAASVPKILLALGAGCLLVAALVFLAVTWSAMGVAGRTATLVGFTLIAGALTAWMARRAQRGAAEALSLVALGLLLLDVFGAESSGWFGDIGPELFTVLLGAVLGAAGACAAVAARRTPVAHLVGAEIVAALGVATVATGVAIGPWFVVSVNLVLAVLVAGAATAGAHAIQLRWTTAGAAVTTFFSWLFLTGYGLDRAFAHHTFEELWLDLQGWPLAVAAVTAASLALLSRLPVAARVAGLSVAELLLAVLVVTPVELTATRMTLMTLAVLAVVGGVAWISPRPWGLASVASFVVGGVWLLLNILTLGTTAAVTVVRTGGRGWSGTLDGTLLRPPAEDLPWPWLLPVMVLSVVAMLIVIRRSANGTVQVAPRLRELVVVLVAAAAAGALLNYPVPVWVALAALLVSALAAAARWLRDSTAVSLAATAVFLGAAVVLSAHDEWLTLAALTVAIAVTGAVHLRARDTLVGLAAGALFAGALTGWTWAALTLTEIAVPWQALTILLVLSAVAIAAPHAPDSWWSAAAPARLSVELTAAVLAAPVAVVALDSGISKEATWLAVYLTVCGAAASITALLRSDRRAVGWAGGALLAAASWVRLWEIGVETPEAYTLPTAVALLVVGVLHLRRQPESSTVFALSAGLGVALAPSLLWALDEPAELRSLILGVGCLLLVLVGLRLHWTAPLVYGGVVGALLVLRLAIPFVDAAVPRWVLIGIAGALLITLGVTWERRLNEARAVLGYVRGLR